MAEHVIRNDEVGGSNPPAGYFKVFKNVTIIMYTNISFSWQPTDPRSHIIIISSELND
jgi:hypothetical protein